MNDFMQIWKISFETGTYPYYQFSKIVSKCYNLKPKSWHLLYILKTIEPIHPESKMCRFCTVKVTQLPLDIYILWHHCC